MGHQRDGLESPKIILPTSSTSSFRRTISTPTGREAGVSFPKGAKAAPGFLVLGQSLPRVLETGGGQVTAKKMWLHHKVLGAILRKRTRCKGSWVR